MIKKRLAKLWPGVLTALVTVLILWLTLAPRPLPEADIPVFEGADKIVHALMFGGLVFVMVLDREVWRIRRESVSGASQVNERWWVAAFCLLAIILGGGIELLQGAMEAGRSCDIADFWADSAGALIAALVAPGIIRLIFSAQSA